MKMIVLISALLLTSGAMAQKSVVVKKGKIKVGDEEIATYDGKGGNAFRMGNLDIILPGSDTPSIKLKEDVYYYENPLFEKNSAWFYEITCAGGQHFFYRAAPYTKKVFGNEVTIYPRKTGNDIIEEMFNDTTPLFITDKKLNSENIARFIATRSYPQEALLAHAKAVEDSIAQVIANTPARNKQAIISLVDETPRETYDGKGKWFAIYQDNQMIGRAYRYSGNATEIHIWKKGPAGYSIMGNNSGCVPVLYTEKLELSNYNFSKEFKVTQVAGKKPFVFKSISLDNVLYDLANAAIAAGLL